MKKLIVVACGLCLFFCQTTNAQKTLKTKKAVFIILDGISADALEQVATPNLDDISNTGAYTRAYVGGDVGGYSQTPTVSAVGYNSLLTGTWANKHNVWGNGIKKPNYNYWNLFRIVEKNNKALKTAVFSTWLENRTKLVGEGLKEAGDIKLDYGFDGFEYDTIKFPHDEGRTYISKIDEHVSKEAQRFILEEGPDLSWVYLEFTDDMGHRYGDSPQFHDAIKLADKQVGRIWKSIKEREATYNEDWMIVITTDHGRSKSNGKGHGGQSERERLTWIVTNHKQTNAYFKNTPGVVDIMPSILKHMEIEIPSILKEEVDGSSFIGKIAISNLTAEKVGNKIELSWKSYGKNQKGLVYVTTTNNFENGGKDTYKKVAKIKSKQQSVTIDVTSLPSNYYKIVLKTGLNSLNKWIVLSTDK